MKNVSIARCSNCGEEKDIQRLYEQLRKFETTKGEAEIRLEGEVQGVYVDNSLAQMAYYLAREHLKREIAHLEGKMRQEMERGSEDISV